MGLLARTSTEDTYSSKGVVLQILIVVTGNSIGLSRINLIFAGLSYDALRRLVILIASANIAAGGGLAFVKAGISTDPRLARLGTKC
jgi:hypothetical protein